MEPDNTASRYSSTVTTTLSGQVRSAAGTQPPAVVSSGPVVDTPFNGVLQPADPTLNPGGSLDQISVSDEVPLNRSDTTEEQIAPRKARFSRQRLLGVGLLLLGVLAATMLGVRIEANKSKNLNASLSSASQRIKPQSTSLTKLNSQLGSVSTASPTGSLTVNGSLVLAPSVQPSSSVAGQLFYNSVTNQVQYYDGTGYVKLQGGNVVTNNTYDSTTVNNTYGGGSTVNNFYSTPTNNTYATYVTNNISNGASIQGTAGTLAMFGSGGSTLANSLISQSGTNVTVGGTTNNIDGGIVNVATSGSSTVSIGSNGGTSTTTLQGGTGGLTISTGSTSGASGSVTIQSGNSSTTASGNISIDAGSGFISGTIVGNIGFEDDTTESVQSWFGNTIAVTSAQTHTGTYSLAETGTGGAWGVILNANAYYFPAVAGHHYVFNAWWRAGTTPRQISGTLIWLNNAHASIGTISFAPVTDTASSWTETTASGGAPAGAIGAYFEFAGTGVSGETHYVDDITATDLSSSAATSTLSLGDANAQIINIGNMNELGATTIDGGSGITLNSGAAPLNESGGTVTIGGSAASSLTTSSGSLTLGSGGGTGGGVTVISQANSTTAFLVQSAGGATTLLNVDSTDSAISLGTSAGTSFGNTHVGSTASSAIGDGQLIASKFTTTTAGTLDSMSVDLALDQDATPNNKYQLAIYSDSSGSPGNYLGSATAGTLTGNGWNNLRFTTPVTVTASTPYWLVYWENGSSNELAYQSGVSSATTATVSSTWQGGTDNGMPATFPVSTPTTGSLFSIYAVYSSSNSALTLNSFGTLTQSGAALFQDPTASTIAFQVQDSLGNSLLTADTADEIVAVGGALTVSGIITINGHIVTGGSTPNIAAGAAACSVPTVSVSGDDTSGTISVTTGTGCATSGTLATITFANAFGATPHIVLTPGGAGAAGLNAYFNNSTLTTAGFSIGTNSTPASSTTYVWDYQVMQ